MLESNNPKHKKFNQTLELGSQLKEKKHLLKKVPTFCESFY